MSLFGPPNIARLKERGKTRELIKALEYRKDSGQTRMQAVKALSDLHCAESAEPIGRLLNELDGLNIDLSVSCTTALGALGSPSAAGHLIAALKRARHQPDLERLLELKRKASLHRAGFAFDLAEKLARDWIKARYKYMQSVRVVAIKALGEIGGPEAVAALSEALGDGNPVAARAAADALARIGGREAVQALSPRLRGTAGGTRRLAARALSRLGIPEARALLQSVSADSDPAVRGYATATGGDWRPPRTEMVTELLELLDFYTDIHIYFMIDSLRPNQPIDQKAVSEAAVKDSVDVIARKYDFIDQAEIDEILRLACQQKDRN